MYSLSHCNAFFRARFHSKGMTLFGIMLKGLIMFQAETKGIVVTVTAEYQPEDSQPQNEHWYFAYTVEITNRSEETVQLLSRHWKITDGLGRLREVEGLGVVGEQPILNPGDQFIYTSGCPMPTPTGIMHGSYRMMGERGVFFDVEIPAFSLDAPDVRRVLN